MTPARLSRGSWPLVRTNVVGTDTARQIVTDALRALTLSLNPRPSTLNSVVRRTHLYMSGAPEFLAGVRRVVGRFRSGHGVA